MVCVGGGGACVCVCVVACVFVYVGGGGGGVLRGVRQTYARSDQARERPSTYGAACSRWPRVRPPSLSYPSHAHAQACAPPHAPVPVQVAQALVQQHLERLELVQHQGALHREDGALQGRFGQAGGTWSMQGGWEVRRSRRWEVRQLGAARGWVASRRGQTVGQWPGGRGPSVAGRHLHAVVDVADEVHGGDLDAEGVRALKDELRAGRHLDLRVR